MNPVEKGKKLKLFYFTSIDLADCQPGAKSHIENILRGLHRLNWEISLFSCSNKRDRQPQYPFAQKLIEKHGLSLLQQLLEQIRLVFLLLYPARENPDAVYIRTSTLLIVPVIYSIWNKIPFFLEVNAATEFFSSYKKLTKIAQIFENWALKKSRAVITTTSELKAYLSSRASLDSNKIHVVPMGFESDLLNLPISQTNSAGLEKPKLVVGFMGQFHKRQGISILINAIPLVVKQHENICFEIAGKGHLEEELEKQVEKLGIANFVKFVGFLDSKSIPRFLKRCDLATAPYFGQFNQRIPMGSPTKIFTCLACGKLVVTTRLPSLELFKPCKAVFFAEPDSPEDLARIVIKLIEMSPSRRYELGRAGREFVKNRYTWEILSKKTSRILEQGLLNSKRNGHYFENGWA